MRQAVFISATSAGRIQVVTVTRILAVVYSGRIAPSYEFRMGNREKINHNCSSRLANMPLAFAIDSTSAAIDGS